MPASASLLAVGPGVSGACDWGPILFLATGMEWDPCPSGQPQGELSDSSSVSLAGPRGVQQEHVHAFVWDDPAGPSSFPTLGGWGVPLARGTEFWALTSTPRLSGLASDPVMPSDGKEILGMEGLFWFVLESGRNENGSGIKTEARV